MRRSKDVGGHFTPVGFFKYQGINSKDHQNALILLIEAVYTILKLAIFWVTFLIVQKQ
jgi:hypothetical protein